MGAATRHHRRRHRLKGFGYFSRLGPAVVTGAADDDPSGIGTYSQVGAAFGFGLLWITIVTLPLAAAVQETAARLGISTGQGLATSIKRRYPPSFEPFIPDAYPSTGPSCRRCRIGRVAERTKATVLKTVSGATGS